MSFLTQMTINPARRGARRLLASPQAMHAAVLHGYPVDDPGRVLWRVDRSARHRVLLYVVGPTEPDLTHLVEQAGWPTTETWRTTDYTPYLSRLDRGQGWRYRLTANPVSSVSAGPGRRGTVKPHVTAAQQEKWLMDRAPSWGFELVGEGAVAVSARGHDAFGRRDGEGRQRPDRVTITRAQFDGVLHIVDADVLRASLTAGMGRAKAYGCGLMTLAPLA